jgi:hypothetical protein
MALNVFCSFDINKYPLQSIGYKLVTCNQPTEKLSFNFRHKTSGSDLTKLGRPV